MSYKVLNIYSLLLLPKCEWQRSEWEIPHAALLCSSSFGDVTQWLRWENMNPKCGGPSISWFLVPKSNHEMRGSWIPGTVYSVKPQNGSKSFQKSTFWAFFHDFSYWNIIFKSIVSWFLNFLLQSVIIIKMIQVISTSEFHEYWWNDTVFFVPFTSCRASKVRM
jgi:hypothetical protein